MENKKIQKKKKELLMFSLIFVILLNINFVLAADTFGGGSVSSSFMGGTYRVYGASANTQFSQPSFHLGAGVNPNQYWSNFNREDCDERQDVILQIPPGGCSPAVVRSDLLEEQNVPVFCKVSSIQVNPLIDITKIRSIRFRGDYPPGVAGVSYYPARAGVRSRNQLIGSPIVDNVGYLVIVLKRVEAEQDMPDSLEGTVTAIIDYDTEGAFGVGQHDFFLTEETDEDWERNYKDYSFWKGKGFIRAEAVGENSARISIYRDATNKETSVNLQKGQTSGDIYLGGFYCAAGMNIVLENVDYPEEKVLLKVDNEDVWVAKGGTFLNGQCRVVRLNLDDIGGGSVSINCNGVESFDLTGRARAFFNIEGEDEIKEVFTGGKITSKDGKNVYLAYAGRYPGAKENYRILVATTSGSPEFDNLGSFAHQKARQWHEGGYKRHYKWRNLFLKIAPTSIKLATWIIGDIELNDEEVKFYAYLLDEISDKYPAFDESNLKIMLITGKPWKEYGITLVDSVRGEEVLEQNPELRQYYDEAIEYYNDVFELYPGEEVVNIKDNINETYGAKALFNSAQLAKYMDSQAEQIRYLEELIENYPGTGLAQQAEHELGQVYGNKFTEDSQGLVYINNEAHFIYLIDIKKPSFEELGAALNFISDNDNKEVEWEKDVIQQIPLIDDKIPIKITEITEEFIEIKYVPNFNWKDSLVNTASTVLIGKNIKWETEKIELNEAVPLTPDVSVTLVNVNLDKEAKVKIIPKIFGTRTESDFSFKIGIEKRAIKLSPEKTQEMIDNLNENLEEWRDINDKLGNVVKGLKGACFATSAMLTIKNFLAGYSGKSMARHDVMTAEGGWNEKCRLMVNQKEYSNIQACLLAHNDKIEDSVNVLTEIYEGENELIEGLQGEPKRTDPLDFEGYVSENKLRKKYCDDYFREFYNQNQNMEVDFGGVIGKQPLSEIIDSSRLAGGNCSVDLGDMKLLRLKESIGSNEVIDKIIEARWKNQLLNTYNNNEILTRNNKLQKAAPGVAPFTPNIKPEYQVMSNVDKAPLAVKPKLAGADKVFSYYYNGQEIIVGLVNVGGNEYEIKDAFLVNGNKAEFSIPGGASGRESYTSAEYFKSIYGIKRFTLANEGVYQNPIVDSEAKVKYYARAPYEGLPAQVPFDKKNGWYVTTDYILSGFGKPYEQSGRALNFWICNVGQNGLIDGRGTDDCRYYNLGTSQDLDFPGLSKSQSAKLVRDAENAIRDASKYYGKDKAYINGEMYATDISFGGESGSCSDFMSPKDCHFMFNVCDPVICPASRCDFGGKYRVANVVQSGIIGSLLLCLPNFDEGIAVPICLSGVHAGIDSYLSILESARDCLQENLDTGRNIGICDEIKSIFLCEFFWKQAVPLMDVLIPKLFELSLGQGVRGGGEYLTVNSAWENMKASVDYFKNEYAVNSIKAFNQRSTAEIGGDVCKSFISARYPNSKEFLDNLLEPDSPVQYTGWFSENILTEATIPPTSHYKVYYHIYAGKDIGAHYVVYLKNPPISSYVHTASSYVVDRGYIERGQQVDEARDFTGISGYEELCININGQEECGFKQVSTSWAINEISNRFVEDAMSQEVSSSEECVSGSPSLWSFAQPNLEAGADEILNPQLYKRGIIRVCSKGNPGTQTEVQMGADASKYDRWKKVGWCDESAGIGCWLDTDSVEDVLRDAPGLLNETIENVDREYLETLDIMPPEDAKTIKSKARALLEAIKNMNIRTFDAGGISNLNDVLADLIDLSERGPSNWYKALGLFNIGRINHEIAWKIYLKTHPEVKPGTSGASDVDEVGEAEEGGEIITEEEIIEEEKLNIIKEGREYYIYSGNKKTEFEYYLTKPKDGKFWLKRPKIGFDTKIAYYTPQSNKFESYNQREIPGFLKDIKFTYDEENDKFEILE